MLSEMCKTQKDRYCVVSLIHGIFELRPPPPKKKNQFQRNRIECWIPGAGRMVNG